ncbi:MAG: HNH endonuclease signature motif containing protein [Cetobacterium sp.]
MSDCILWGGSKDKSGYGRRKVDGKVRYVHRLEYIKHHGPIPEGLVVRHSCDNPACFNIAHLSIGTMKDNVQDCIERGRIYRAKGEHQHKAVLTEQTVRLIRSSQLSGGALAKQLGVSKNTVNDVRSGKTWRHVDG